MELEMAAVPTAVPVTLTPTVTRHWWMLRKSLLMEVTQIMKFNWLDVDFWWYPFLYLFWSQEKPSTEKPAEAGQAPIPVPTPVRAAVNGGGQDGDGVETPKTDQPEVPPDVALLSETQLPETKHSDAEKTEDNDNKEDKGDKKDDKEDKKDDKEDKKDDKDDKETLGKVEEEDKGEAVSRKAIYVGPNLALEIYSYCHCNQSLKVLLV